MRKVPRLMLVAGGLLILTVGQHAAADDARPVIQATPIQSDARLNDVQFVGSRVGWIVGDHGVVWRSQDGGESWNLVPTPVDCSLHSVCFLTDRVGWIVGGGTRSYGRLPYGVVLATGDAGLSWQVLAGQSAQSRDSRGDDDDEFEARQFLPRLHKVRFFDLKHGIVVGEASHRMRTGVMATADGGRSWQSLTNESKTEESKTEGLNPGFRTAAFVRSTDDQFTGVVAGQRGRTAIVGGGQLRETSFGFSGLKGATDIALQPNHGGWIVGDGGLIRHSKDGVTWTAAPGAMPEALADFCDFKSVAVHGKHVWIAGDPGGMVMHSADGGNSWAIQRTGQTVPIRRIRFSDDRNGWAVGELGLVLRTKDSGENWQAVRGAKHRAAMMGFFTRGARLSLTLMAQQSAELGHRAVMVVPSRRDLGQDGFDESDLDVRLHEATIRMGGSAGQLDWRFPIAVPDIERNRDALLADWNRRTDGRFTEIMLSRLVCQLRTWRPDVVLTDDSAADDVASQLLNQAVMRAISDAADPLKFPRHQSLAHLEPWEVKRVFQRQRDGSAGDVVVEPHKYLPRMEQTAAVLGQRVVGLLTGRNEPPGIQSFRLVQPEDATSTNNPFAGLSMSPGSDARRLLAPLNDRQLGAGQKIAARRRNLESWASQTFADASKADQAIAQLRSTIRDLTPDQSAGLLTALAGICRQHQNYEQAETILIELVALFPDQDAAADALAWLFVRMGSEELNWQRVQAMSVQRDSSRDPSVMKRAIGQAGGLSSDRTLVRQAGGLELNGTNARQLKADEARKQSARFAHLMRARWPDLAERVETQFAMASMLRSTGSTGPGRGLLGQLTQTAGLWGNTARAEMWLLTRADVCPKPLTICRVAKQRPHLDAVLSDGVWQDALELRLGVNDIDRQDQQKSLAMVMLAHDDRFLYIAGSVPRNGAAPLDSPQQHGRTHDADLRDFDRISIRLDTDRDYATWYTLEIDQRGWTRDACHEDTGWNPQWFVAADGDERRWRFEAAIPLNELVSRNPLPNTTWAIGVSRTIPAVRAEGWTSPVSSKPRPEAFGLMRFE